MASAVETGRRAEPARVFISYKRNVDPDHWLAARIYQCLSALGHAVFIDRTLRVGQEWAGEIEGRIRECDFLIVLLTEASSHSEMVKGEIEIARDQAARPAGKPQILPIRVAFAGSLPYPLNAYLDKVQYALWRGESDTDRVLGEIRAAIDGQALETPADLAPAPGPARGQPPTHSAPLPLPGGTLDLDDPCYLPRPTDAEALRIIRQPGQTISIKGPRQMGKSSLLVRLVSAALEAGKQPVLLDFQLLDASTTASRDLFFPRFTRSIADELKLPDKVEEFWDPQSTHPQNCTRYVEKEVLARIDGPVTLAIDEADILFGSPFRNDFFAMLRSWNNNRGNPLKKMWRKLDLVLVTSTEPYLFIDRGDQSPFNVGAVLELKDFPPAQVEEMNRLHGSPLFPQEVERLVRLLSGHPYLTRKALYMVSGEQPGLTSSGLFEQACEDTGPFGDHLRNYLLRLHQKADLVRAFWEIVNGRGCDDEPLCYRLRSAGLVKREAGTVVPRCQLYGEYFRERLHPHA